jgi:hypothetical protein
MYGEMLQHRRTGYDWRRWEARLNGYPQLTTDIGGQKHPPPAPTLGRE